MNNNSNFKVTQTTLNACCAVYTLDKEFVEIRKSANEDGIILRWDFLDEFIDELVGIQKMRTSLGIGG